MVDPI